MAGDISTGLVSHWKFNTGTPLVDTVDSVTLTPSPNDTYLSFPSGKINQCADLNYELTDNAKLELRAGQVTSWDALTDATVNFWFKMPGGSYGSDEYVWIRYDGTNNYCFTARRGGNAGYIYAAGYGYADTSALCPAEEWFMVTVYMDSVNGKFGCYFTTTGDGEVKVAELSGEGEFGGSFTVNNIGSIASSPPYNPAQFMVDDFRVYNRILTADDRALLWNSGSGTEDGDPSSDIVGILPMYKPVRA